MKLNERVNLIKQWVTSASPRDVIAYFLMTSAKHFEKYIGVQITPMHYYSAVPAIHSLGPDVFDKQYDCLGIDWNLARQMEYCHGIFPKYEKEYSELSNTGYDSFVHYSMVREKKPNIMVEVGAGGSTKVSLAALDKNRDEGRPGRLYSVDPNPQQYLRAIGHKSFSLIEKKIQDVEPELLCNADLLFIDSSHVCKIGGDVNVEILEIVPKLKVGAMVQWHDIVIPNNYDKEWIRAGLFFNESYMVHAFMLFNTAFKVIWASRYMQLKHPQEISSTFAHLAATESEKSSVSFWVERVS